MLARRGTLQHPRSGRIELPLLVPAFSSKGFDFHRDEDGKEYSDVVVDLAQWPKLGGQSVLISAYDLHFGHFGGPRAEGGSPGDWLLSASLVFMDSGGYELAGGFDSTEPKSFVYVPKPGFGNTEYQTVVELTLADSDLPLVVANYDHESLNIPLEEQIKKGRALFLPWRGDVLTDFIIKPWTKSGSVVDPSDLARSDFAKLRDFDIIGVTEKELGRDMLKRLKSVAILRRGLDDAGIGSPIHIWGGLDPLLTPLYFFAGAEIFDGVSWLRYSYHKGVAVSRDCHGLLREEFGLVGKTVNEMLANVHNVQALLNLTASLEEWVDTDGEQFDMFQPLVKERLAAAYRHMSTKIPELQEGG